MAGSFTANTTYAEIADNAALDLLDTGWVLFFFVYPSSSVGGSTNQYIYSHGQPLATVSAINLFRVGTGGTTMRLIIDWTGGNLFDSTTTTALLTLDTWNTVVLAYDGTNIFLGAGANGVANVETGSPPALPTIPPIGVARIGQSSWTTAGTRWWVGRIAHAAKADIAIGLADVQRLCSSYLSPDFYPRTVVWHVPFWDDQFWDQNGVVSVTNVGLSWLPHGPFVYPSPPWQGNASPGSAVVANAIYQYFRYG